MNAPPTNLEPRLLFRVTHVFDICDRGLFLVPGIPLSFLPQLPRGASLLLRRPDRTTLASVVKDLEMIKASAKAHSVSILLPSELKECDVPVGTEVWLLTPLPHVMLPVGDLHVAASHAKPAPVQEVLARLQQLGVTVTDRPSNPVLGYDYELRLSHHTSYPTTVLVEIGYLMALLTGHAEEYVGFGGTCVAPNWESHGSAVGARSLRVDTDPQYLSFRFDVLGKTAD